MADTAAHLVDRVFPVAPVRQWVLTVPWALRYRMAYDAALTSDILRELVRAVFASLRRRARRGKNLGPKPRCGAVTFIQRFGGALNLNVHFHSLILDGVFEDERFRALPPPDDQELLRVAASLRARGRKVEVFCEPERKLKKQLAYASEVGAVTVAIVGTAELARGVVKLKDLTTGEQREEPLEDDRE